MDANTPRVSVLAANYNSSRYVIDSLNSIRAQTYSNIELIIIDDGSSDDSPEKIHEWLKDFSKPFKYIIHKENKGICATCNELVMNAAGKYISFMATDDMYLPKKIANQVNLMEAQGPSVAMIYSDTYLIDEHGKKKPGTYMVSMCNLKAEHIPFENITQALTEINFLHWITVLVKKDVYSEVGMYDENLAFEDYDMSIRISKRFPIVYTPDIQTLYRTHAQSFSGRTSNWDELLLPLYFKHIDLKAFKEKIEEIIISKYLKKHPGTDKLALKYYEKTGLKFRYYDFVVNNVHPFFMKAYRKTKAAFG